MSKGFLIYEETRKYLVIYEEAVSHSLVWLCTRFLLKFPVFCSVLPQIKLKFSSWLLLYLDGDIVCLPVCLWPGVSLPYTEHAQPSAIRPPAREHQPLVSLLRAAQHFQPIIALLLFSEISFLENARNKSLLCWSFKEQWWTTAFKFLFSHSCKLFQNRYAFNRFRHCFV
jgi:hypothetical protein